MLEARKENKVYQINDTQKSRYLREGFDIYEDGKVVEYTPLKTIKYNDHLKVVAQVVAEKDAQIADLTALKATIPADVTTLLKEYATAKEIDVGSATTAKGILEKILEAEKA